MLAPGVWEKVELVSPDARALSEYAGEWYSPDLDVKYQIAVKDNRLQWSYPVNESGYVLTPFVKDQFHYFTEGGVHVDFEFKRDRNGAIVKLDVTGPRAATFDLNERVLA